MGKQRVGPLAQNGKVETVFRQCRIIDQKLDHIASELAEKSARNSTVLNQKINRIAAALAKTNRKLDYMAEEFTPQQTASRRYQVA